MRWRPSWELDTIPDELLKAEWARRNSLRRKVRRGGTAPGCDCGQCRRCQQREYMRRYRAQRQQREE